MSGPYSHDRITRGLNTRRLLADAQQIFGDTACRDCLHRSDYHIYRHGRWKCISCRCVGYTPCPPPWTPIRA